VGRCPARNGPSTPDASSLTITRSEPRTDIRLSRKHVSVLASQYRWYAAVYADGRRFVSRLLKRHFHGRSQHPLNQRQHFGPALSLLMHEVAPERRSDLVAAHTYKLAARGTRRRAACEPAPPRARPRRRLRGSSPRNGDPGPRLERDVQHIEPCAPAGHIGVVLQRSVDQCGVATPLTLFPHPNRAASEGCATRYSGSGRNEVSQTVDPAKAASTPVAIHSVWIGLSVHDYVCCYAHLPFCLPAWTAQRVTLAPAASSPLPYRDLLRRHDECDRSLFGLHEC
jgi:hypothetical protein